MAIGRLEPNRPTAPVTPCPHAGPAPGADLVPPEEIRRIVYDVGVPYDMPSRRNPSTLFGPKMGIRPRLESAAPAVKRLPQPTGHDHQPRRDDG
jgi:hypothetical protein